MDFSQIIDSLIHSLGVEPAILMGILAVVSLICRLIGLMIPDDAVGWKAVVRKVCKVIGLYASNRITSGVSTNDVARAVLDAKVPVKGEDGRFTSTTVESLARKP